MISILRFATDLSVAFNFLRFQQFIILYVVYAHTLNIKNVFQFSVILFAFYPLLRYIDYFYNELGGNTMDKFP